MSSIDNRIVNMQFNNREFEKNAGQTLTTLGDLRGALKLDGIASGVENVSSKFNAFGAIAFSVLNTITNAALKTGRQIVASVLDPLIEGGQRRALNIEQAKFQLEGLGLDVERVFGLALEAVQGTAFGLDEAAKAASNLGASQVSLEQMGVALKAISGVAALSGSSYADIADVFQTVAGQGRLMGNDLNRLASRGVNAAATLAKAFGITELEVRDMVSKGQISFEMFSTAMDDAFGEHATKANETYTGSLANVRAALSRIGAAFATSNFEKQRRIFNALMPVIDGLGMALKPLMKLFDEGALRSAKSWEKFLSAFAVKNADGMVETRGILKDLVEAMVPFSRALEYLRKISSRVFGIIGDAFKKVFPSGSGGPVTVLTDMAKAFERFANTIRISSETAKVISNVFTGLFLIFRVIGSILWGVVQVGWTAVTMFGSLVGAIFKLLAPIGTFVKSLFPMAAGADTATDSISTFFDKVIEFLNVINNDFIGGLGKAADAFDAWLNSGGPLRVITDIAAGVVWLGEAIAEVWRILTTGNLAEGSMFDPGSAFVKGLMILRDLLKPLGSLLVDVGEGVGSFFSALGEGVKYGFENIDWGLVIGGMFAGLGGALIYEGARLIRLTWTQIDNLISPMAKSMTLFQEIFRDFSGVAVAMQQQIKADALMKIAIALLVLAAAMAVISLIDPDKLVGSMVALGLGLLAILSALETVSKLNAGGFLKLPLLVGAMMALGGALLLIAGAVYLLGLLPAEKIAAGTTALTALMATLVGTAILMSKYVSGITMSAGAMILLATALNLLVIPILALGNMKLEKLVQGTVALAGVLGALVGISMILGNPKLQKNMVGASFALTLMAGALYLLIVPILALAFLPFNNLIQGMLGVSVMLGVLVGVAILLSKAKMQIAIASLALIALGAALNLLVIPILALAFIPFENLMTGLIGVGLALGILGGAAALLGLAGPALLIGAAGILMLGLALWLMVPPVLAISMLDFGTLIGSLSGLGLALLILSAASLLAAPGLLLAAPALLIFAIALAGIAISFAIFTAAVMVLTPALGLFGIALQEFATQLPAMIQFVPAFFALGAALLIFGAGALVAGIGLTIMGVGLAVFAAGLWVLNALAGPGAEALESFGMAIAKMALIAPAIIITAGALLILGAAVVVLGAGLLVMGLGMAIFAAAMLLITVIGAAGAAALGFLFQALVGFVEQVPALLLMVVAITALGVAILLLGAGLLVLGLGAAVATGGLALLQLVAYSGGMALIFLAQAVMMSAGAIPALFGLGAGFIVLGAGLTVFAVGAGLSALALMLLVPGILLMGMGVKMLATSLMLLAIVGSAGTRTLGTFIESLDGLVWQVPALTALGVAFLALGAGLLVVGTGLLVLGAGSVIAATGLMLMMAISSRVDKTFASLLVSLQAFTPAIGHMSIIAKVVLVLAMALYELSESSGKVASNVESAKKALAGVKTEAEGAESTLSGMLSSVVAKLPAFRNNLNSATSSYREFVKDITNLSRELERALKSSGVKSEKAAEELVDKTIAALMLGLLSSRELLKKRGYSVGDSIVLGIASGLQNRSSYLNRIARNVALNALESSKDALGIRSPSKEYEKVGEQADNGLAVGLIKYSSVAEDAARDLGENSISELRNSLSSMKNIIGENLPDDPTIRPVLDLSAIRKDARLIGSALAVRPIEVDGSYNQAAAISANNRAKAQEEAFRDSESDGDSNVTFIQNNNSPKALPRTEIYRRTKNQISMAKDKLVKK